MACGTARVRLLDLPVDDRVIGVTRAKDHWDILL